MHLFYTPDIISNDTYVLNEEESNHCNRVLRLGLGDKVNLVDGHGGFYDAVICTVSKKKVQLQIVNKQAEFQKRNHYLHIAIAPTKNIDRIEWFLEKATEIGIDEITPILCERSERKQIKEDRLNKVITSAMKQSLKAYHPQLNALSPLSSLLSNTQSNIKLIAHCLEDGKRQSISNLLPKHNNCLILIGPEGDFTSKEIELALQNNFKPVTLGNSRLRTETAGLAACFEVNFLNRDKE